jgi:hypothetical protein
MEALDSKERPARGWLLAGIGAAGLYLVHMRVALFYGLFVGLWFLLKLFGTWQRREAKQAKQLVIGALVTGGIALILVLPWLLRFFRGFGGVMAQEVTAGYEGERYGSYFRWRAEDLIEFGMPWGLLLLATSGAVLGIAKKNRSVCLLVVWMLTLFAAANTHLIGITPLFSNLVASISLYLPLATLIGYLVAWLAEWADRFAREHTSRHRLLRPSAAVALVLISLAGVPSTAGLFEPSARFVLPADLDAMEWIEQHVPQDALFHIGTHFWTPLLAHGIDAGYWIPYLAHRETTIPVETYATDGSAEYMELVNRRARDLLDATTPETLWQVMRRYNVTHFYLGSRPTNFSPEFFLEDPARFRPLYSANGVWIFETVD